MDKLFDHKSRFGWMSVVPVLVVALLFSLALQYFLLYSNIMSLINKHHVDPVFADEVQKVIVYRFYAGFVVIGFLSLAFLVVYLFEKRRVDRQNKDLSKNIKNLSILSLIAENNNIAPREKM